MRISLALPLLALLQVLALQPSAAQETLLTKALVIRSAPGFPDNVALKDPVEAALVESTWKKPAAGDLIRYNDTLSAAWEPITADSAGWFDHPSMSAAYLYCEIEWPRDEIMLLEPMGNIMAYVNGEPRAGNPYGTQETYQSWEPHFDYTSLPVALHRGTNWFLFQCSRGVFKARLRPPPSEHFFNTKDCTLPDLVADTPLESPASVVVTNASSVAMKGWKIIAKIDGESERVSDVPLIQPMSLRKIPFTLSSRPRSGSADVHVSLRLICEGKTTDTASLRLRVVSSRAPRKETFISAIDGSAQYYAVNPATNDSGPKALILSLHGASVEAINQASSYAPKSWAAIVCPTNRRPYGFNWEDWGRSDAMEVLAIAREKFHPDESRVYLTGHSMGGHGTYHVGSLFPDQFAAIAPSAGWISFWSYRVREKSENPSPLRQMIMRTTLASDTYAMGRNFAGLGLYILHGSDDDNVPPEQSRSMAKYLAGFHTDFIFHEEKSAGHWWDKFDEPGADCVDWPPMFDFFARHARPEAARIRELHFATPNPGISSKYFWASIEAQTEQMRLSSIDLRVDPSLRRFVGTTQNIRRLAIDVHVLLSPGELAVGIDSQKIGNIVWPKDGRLWMERNAGIWKITGEPSPDLKNPRRNGSFRDVIGHRVVLVYATHGNPEENRWAFVKSRFDAERFWYQGNGSLEVLADTEFTLAASAGRNVLLYGNANTNLAWSALLRESPVQIGSGVLRFGDHEAKGDDISCVFIRPRPGSANCSVGVVGGSGIRGMRGTNKMPYLLPGIGIPDFLFTRTSALTIGEAGIIAAGFFGDDWNIRDDEMVKLH